jgi:hypothetical protein
LFGTGSSKVSLSRQLNVGGYDGPMAVYQDLVYDSENDDYFDEDAYEDEFFEDDEDDIEEDRTNKIFVTLQDSHVIQRLSFHKKTNGMFR